MSNKQKTNQKVNIRKMTVTAILGAVAAVLMFLEFSVPVMPPYIKFDFSDLPELVAAFAFGPVSGVTVCLIKCLVKLFITTTGGVGELSNFILGCVFVIPAGLIYKHNKTKKSAVIGSFVGALVSAIVSFFSNRFFVYPIYENFMPRETIIKSYNILLPSITNLSQAILIFNVPFTFVKYMIDAVIVILIYKYISPILKGKF